MTTKKEDIFSSEVTNRLSDFFGEQDLSPSSTNQNKFSDPQDSPLMNLNAILLSIEWEITDEILTGLITEIERLKNVYREDKIVFSFLKLHGSVGNYIKTKKVTAHPDSIKLLHSVYSGLEEVVKSPEMSESQKKRLLTGEVEKFKTLKELILAAKKKAPGGKEIKPSDAPSSAVQTEKVHPQVTETKIVSQDVVIMLDEIKKIIQAEFEILKAELNLFLKDRLDR